MIANDIIAGMVGIMLFFTVVVAPTVFKVLPMEWSGKYVRNFFPKYYASLGLLSLAAAFLDSDLHSRTVLLVCAALFAFLLFYLTRQINAAKDKQQNKRFHWLHGLSVLLNLGQLAAFVYLLVA